MEEKPLLTYNTGAKKMGKLKKSTKDLMGLGITGMAGLGAIGAMGNIPGMPKEAAGVPKMAGIGVNLAMTGGLLQVTKDIFGEEKTKKKTTKRKK